MEDYQNAAPDYPVLENVALSGGALCIDPGTPVDLNLPVRVRPAVVGDIAALVQLARFDFEHTALSHLPYCERRTAEHLQWLLADGQLAVVLVQQVQGGERIVGFLLAEMWQLWFSPAKAADMVAIFLHPGLRGRHYGPRLLRLFVRWAQSCGAAVVSAGVVSGCTQADGILRHMGFKPLGGNFAMKGV